MIGARLGHAPTPNDRFLRIVAHGQPPIYPLMDPQYDPVVRRQRARKETEDRERSDAGARRRRRVQRTALAGEESSTSKDIQAGVAVYDHVEISAFPGVDHLIVVQADKETVDFLLAFFYYKYDPAMQPWNGGISNPLHLSKARAAAHQVRRSFVGSGVGAGSGRGRA